MTKEIQYPTQEWLDQWVDKWLDKHPDTKVDNFDELNAQAQDAWWDAQVDKGNPTPFDLTAEEKKNAKEAMNGMAKAKKKPANYSLEGKKPRERKPNDLKREIISVLNGTLCDFADNVQVANIERQIDFEMNGKHFSITLTEHRPPKEK